MLIFTPYLKLEGTPADTAPAELLEPDTLRLGRSVGLEGRRWCRRGSVAVERRRTVAPGEVVLMSDRRGSLRTLRGKSATAASASERFQ
jgi:hypothetical protein